MTEIGRYRPDNRAAVDALYRRVFGADAADASRLRWDWQYQGNPNNPLGGPQIWIAREGPTVIGQYAGMPVRHGKASVNSSAGPGIATSAPRSGLACRNRHIGSSRRCRGRMSGPFRALSSHSRGVPSGGRTGPYRSIVSFPPWPHRTSGSSRVLGRSEPRRSRFGILTNAVNGNRKPHICGNRKLHTSGRYISGGADVLPLMLVGRFGLDAGSGATGVLANTRREAAQPAVTLRLSHAAVPTQPAASADAPASGSCCPGC